MEKSGGGQDQGNKQYRNGALLCSAHPGIVDDIKEIKDSIKEVHDYIILRKKVFELIFDNKFASGFIVGVALLLVAYFTVL